jgi:two-component system, OmpR family, phosphate regulon sensor histidine kinase PhoR
MGLEIVVIALLSALVGLGYAYWRLHQQSSENQLSLLALQKKFTERQTESSRLQQLLEEKEQTSTYKLALTLTLSNAAFDALIVLNRENTIIASNSSAEALFNNQKLVGQKLGTVTDNPSFDMMVESALANEEETFEEQMSIRDRAYRVRTQVIRRDGNLFIGLALQDVTQLVRLNRARRDMVANISHELRTPIANIRLIIDGLFHEQGKPKRKESISSLRAIARETDSLLWLVQEMADLSMIESGQAIVRLVEVPLVEVVNEAVERLADQTASKNLNIVRHIPEKVNVLCDSDLIQRVFVNLIHNALKWSPPGQSITLSAISSRDEVTISVFDNGPGVPEDQVERIFERFYQVDASRSGHDGTGLGLAICRHIVEAHGGRIWAESNRKGSGGRFLFTLLNTESGEAPSPAPHIQDEKLP